MSSTSLGFTTQTTLARRSLTVVAASQAIRNLATGTRINRAADGPTQLISSQSLRATLASLDGQVSGLQRTSQVAATADAALAEVSGLLAQAGALEVQLANEGALGDGEKAAIHAELDSILQEVDRIGSSASFNGQNLLGGSTTLYAGRDTLELGAVSTMELGRIEVDGVAVRLQAIGSSALLADDPAGAAQVVAAAANDVAVQRARIGNFQSNTVDTRLNLFGVAVENLSAADAVATGADLAAETANIARLGLLEAAALKALSIANRNQQTAFYLLL